MKHLTYLCAAALLLLGFGCSREPGPVKQSNASRTDPGSLSTLWNWIDNKTDNGANGPALRRLESLTWDSVKHQLSWDVSRGEKKGDAYQPNGADRYEIDMDKATMTVNGESRRFSEEEAANVRTLMDFISRYALESTVWWESGEGEPVDGSAPRQPGKSPEDRIDKGKAKNIRVIAMRPGGN